MSHNIAVNFESVRVNLELVQIKEIISQLKPREFVALIKEYQRKNWIKELDKLSKELCASARVSEKEIDQMVKEVRKTTYAKANRCN